MLTEFSVLPRSLRGAHTRCFLQSLRRVLWLLLGSCRDLGIEAGDPAGYPCWEGDLMFLCQASSPVRGRLTGPTLELGVSIKCGNTHNTLGGNTRNE